MRASQSFAVVAIAYIVCQFYRVSNAVIAPELMRSLSISPEAMGLVTGLFFFAFAAMQIPTGILLDRFGPRLTMAGLLALAAGGSAIFALADSVPALMFGRASIGVGCAAGLMGGLVIISRWYPPERFATMSSWLFTIGGVGTLLATTPLAAISDWIGWRGAFWLMAAATLLMAALIVLLVRDRPGTDHDARAQGESLAQIRHGLATVIKNRQLWHVSALQFVSYGALLTIAGLWGGPYLNDVHELGGVARGNVLLTINIATLCGVMAYSMIERRVGSRKRTIIGGALMSAALLLVLAMVPRLGLITAVALLTVFSFVGAYVMLLHSHARALLPDHLIGRGLTLQNLAVFLGIATLQSTSGYIVGAYTQGSSGAPELAYRWVFAALAGVILIAVAAYAPVRDVRLDGKPSA